MSLLKVNFIFSLTVIQYEDPQEISSESFSHALISLYPSNKDVP